MNNTFENNKLISVFMGFETYPDIVDDRTRAYDVGDYIKADNSNNENDENIFHPDDMQFHKSWDWLMPVIDKCYQEHMSKHIADAVMTCDKDKAFQAVVEFINEYNKAIQYERQ